LFDGSGYGGGSGVYFQLGVDVGEVGLDRRLADEEAFGEFAVRLAGGEQAEDLDLAVRQGAGDLVNADGLVRDDDLLWVVRNFSRVLKTLRLSQDGSTASLVSAIATDPARVFTTAKPAQGRLLLVDSKFDEPVAAPPYQVVTLTPPRG
jgi:hypothetical protein